MNGWEEIGTIFFGEVTVDPLNSINHVYHPTPANGYARFFSPHATKFKKTVVKIVLGIPILIH